MQKQLTAILFCGFFLSLGCGGGGSSSTTAVDIEGRWTGTLALITDQCLGETEARVETEVVSRDGDNVTVFTSDGRAHLGQMISDDSFSAEAVSTGSFPVVERITYTNISDGRAQVELERVLSRPSECSTAWSGELVQE